MNSTRLGAIMAMLVAGQALGQSSQITYTLELGGDNHRSAFKSPASCGDALPLFTNAAPQTGNVGLKSGIITWDAKVSVAGTHATGAPNGVANVVFSLELRDNAGALVAGFGKGSASTGGYFSSINDGTGRVAPGPSACGPAQPDEAGAFTYAFNLDGVNNGRLIDTLQSGGGPGFDYYQYPSLGANTAFATGYPAGAAYDAGTNPNGVQGGQLAGMGAGYSKLIGSGCPSLCDIGSQTVGVGVATCGLGSPPIAEGQINLDGLAAGTYTLTLVPGTGNNILRGDVACSSSVDEGDFAVAPDLATLGSSITFFVQPPITCARTVVGRYVFYNNSFYDTPGTGAQGCNTLFNGGQPCNDNSAAPTNIVALLPGQAPVVPVPAAHGVVANYINYTKGINGIIVDIGRSPTCPAIAAGAMSPAQIAATFEFKETVAGNSGRAVNSAYTGATRVPTSVTVAPHPTLANTDRLTVIFADNTSTNGHWMRTRILSGGSVGDVTPISGGDLDRFYFGLAIAEGYSPSSSAGVFYATATTTDQTDPKPPNNHTTFNRAPLNESYDYNRNSVVDSTDQTLPKAPNNTTTFTALSLGGVAP